MMKKGSVPGKVFLSAVDTGKTRCPAPQRFCDTVSGVVLNLLKVTVCTKAST
jgi:hypothetical protein